MTIAKGVVFFHAYYLLSLYGWAGLTAEVVVGRIG